jgi:hypothetical protein
MLGAGKYDDLCTEIREKTKARAVLLVVFDGTKGQGFSLQTDLITLAALPRILRVLAEEIEQSGGTV